MTTFIEQRLSAPGWWFDYVLTPLAVLLIVYLLRRGYSRFTTWRATNSASKRAYRAQLVSGVRADPERLLWIRLEATTCRLQSIGVLVFAGFFMMVWVSLRFGGLALGNSGFLIEWFVVALAFLSIVGATKVAERAALLEGVLKEFEPEWAQPQRNG